ncbi:MAG: hypothetical protein GY874_10055 [Desulfobacteraceae bacterium]|nr:hypothetical protein [Desulfobacteraceae bacterium]
MKPKSQYDEGHLFVAAIRLLEHQHVTPPSLDQISFLLGISLEQTGLISRRLKEAEIIDEVEIAYAIRLVIKNHLKLEDLSDEQESSELDNALKKFQLERQKMTDKIELIKEQQAQKKKDLFDDIEKKLKKDLKPE